ncbi:probable low affinity copper uptake protein 2 [Clupea harengus]|uniref:Copper transport protein n=1 Tax=Clupea harengus TaxID=7950 RepID=A0A6P3WF22_CLUHA|nr:probable low affinity copper uptake protein 2 [Clupea harengus]
MSMHFEASSSVTLLFDFWDVHGPAGMVLSVFVVLLFTIFYELLKVWKVGLSERSQTPCPPPFPSPLSPSGACFPPPPACFSPQLESHDSISELASSPSESSLNPADSASTATNTSLNSWLVHGLQTLLHIAQVTLGYMLMLCVMTYNVWIFLGVIVGSVLGYFLAFPLLGKV